MASRKTVVFQKRKNFCQAGPYRVRKRAVDSIRRRYRVHLAILFFKDMIRQAAKTDAALESIAKARGQALLTLTEYRNKLAQIEVTRLSKSRTGYANWISFWERVYQRRVAEAIMTCVGYARSQIDTLFRVEADVLRRLMQIAEASMPRLPTKPAIRVVSKALEALMIGVRRRRRKKARWILDRLRTDIAQIPLIVGDDAFIDIKRGVFGLDAACNYHPGDPQAEELERPFVVALWSYADRKFLLPPGVYRQWQDKEIAKHLMAFYEWHWDRAHGRIFRCDKSHHAMCVVCAARCMRCCLIVHVDFHICDFSPVYGLDIPERVYVDPRTRLVVPKTYIERMPIGHRLRALLGEQTPPLVNGSGTEDSMSSSGSITPSNIVTPDDRGSSSPASSETGSIIHHEIPEDSRYCPRVEFVTSDGTHIYLRMPYDYFADDEAYEKAYSADPTRHTLCYEPGGIDHGRVYGTQRTRSTSYYQTGDIDYERAFNMEPTEGAPRHQISGNDCQPAYSRDPTGWARESDSHGGLHGHGHRVS